MKKLRLKGMKEFPMWVNRYYQQVLVLTTKLAALRTLKCRPSGWREKIV